jgi:ParB-like chromosome segregation protein Spo0J
MSYIAAPLRRLAVPVGRLKADPGNARTHDDRNIDAVAASLSRFGQQKPVVCDSGGRLIAGHATLLAARRLGWTHLAAVRSDLAGPERTAYGIADNRTAELAAWDTQALAAALAELQPSADALAATGFSLEEMEALLAATGESATAPASAAPEPHRWTIFIECVSEQEQKRLLKRFAAQGLKCRAATE